MLNASVRPSVRPFIRPSVCLSFCLSETKIWSTFRSVLLEFKGGPRSGRATKKLSSALRSTSSIRLMRPSVRPSVCLSETKIWSTFRSVLLEFKVVRGADVQQKN